MISAFSIGYAATHLVPTYSIYYRLMWNECEWEHGITERCDCGVESGRLDFIEFGVARLIPTNHSIRSIKSISIRLIDIVFNFHS